MKKILLLATLIIGCSTPTQIENQPSAPKILKQADIYQLSTIQTWDTISGDTSLPHTWLSSGYAHIEHNWHTGDTQLIGSFVYDSDGAFTSWTGDPDDTLYNTLIARHDRGYWPFSAVRDSASWFVLIVDLEDSLARMYSHKSASGYYYRFFEHDSSGNISKETQMILDDTVYSVFPYRIVDTLNYSIALIKNFYW